LHAAEGSLRPSAVLAQSSDARCISFTAQRFQLYDADGTALVTAVTAPQVSTTPAALPATAATAPRYEGTQVVTCEVVFGWAWDRSNPDAAVEVAIFADTTL